MHSVFHNNYVRLCCYSIETYADIEDVVQNVRGFSLSKEPSLMASAAPGERDITKVSAFYLEKLLSAIYDPGRQIL